MLRKTTSSQFCKDCIPLRILPPYRNSLFLYKNQDFNPTCCSPYSPLPPPSVFILFSAASLPDQSLKIFKLAYFDLEMKSYLLCILFVVLEEPQHSFKGVQNDFLNTFLSLLQLNKVELWLVLHRGARKRHPWIKMGGPGWALLPHNAGVYCWNLLIPQLRTPWELQSGGKSDSLLCSAASSIERPAKAPKALPRNWDI